MLEVLEVSEVMCSMLLRMLEVVEGELCFLEVLQVLEAQELMEMMCCVRLCMLEVVEGKFCLLEAHVSKLEAVEVSSVCWRYRRYRW